MDSVKVHLPVNFIKELSSTTSTGEITAVVARWFALIFQADRASITIAEQENLRVIALAGNDVIPIERVLPILGTMVGRVYQSKKAELCEDLTVSADLDCQALAENGLLSCVDAPLLYKELCFGTINIGSTTRAAFKNDDKERLEALGQLIATLMHVHSQADQLRIAAEHDPLTGMLNRRAFSRYFSFKRTIGIKNGYGLALIDLDHFKSINDRFGHGLGDRVLIHVSAVLQSVCRKEDLVARFGGEEFIIAIDGCTAQQFNSLLLRIQKKFRGTPLATEHGDIYVTASMGAIFVQEFLPDFEYIYSKVDKALYKAKQLGRDRFEFSESAAQ